MTDLLIERRGDVDVLTLNRPDARNALTWELYADLEHAVRESTARCILTPAPTPRSVPATT